METERSPLSGTTVPRYTFISGGNHSKRNAGRLQCCCWAAFAILLVVTIVMLLSYFLSMSSLDRASNSSQALDGLMQLQWPIQEEKYNDVSINLPNETKAFEIGAEGLKERDLIEDILPSMPIDSPAFRHQLATPTTKEAQEMSRLGFFFNMVAKEMNKREKKPRRWAHTSSTPVIIRCGMSVYRTSDGTCNNLKHPMWGASLRPFRRILLPSYEDGVSKPRGGLPSAREVSLAIHRPAYKNDVNFTVMLAVWGQFIDHDITSTALSKGKHGAPIRCCQTAHTHPECFPVPIGSSDPFYIQHNMSCMEFVRSAPAPTDFYGPREQLNQATSFLDGSVVYGNDAETMNRLRTFTGGELKMLKTSVGDLLPVSEELDDGCNRRKEFKRGRYCFSTGDSRANENLLLTSMHLLFARHHNSIAKKLSKLNSHWGDERLFQESRKIVGAQIQHITYNEFLPSVLPARLMTHLNLSTELRKRNLYNSSVDPTVANVFASAAFRFGHTLLPGLIRFLRNNATRKEYLQLHKMLFNPFELFQTGFLESLMKGAMNTSSSKSDVYFSNEVTQKLFQKEPKNHYGLDLVSLNIQRGRDHGLPSYPNWRAVCGLKKPETFADLSKDIDEDTLNKLQKLYKSVDDLDLYTGGLAEKPVAGGLLGPTISCLIADQFLRLKIGDRFWYEWMEGPEKYTTEQVNQIRKTSLAGVICDTSEVSATQPHVMSRFGAGNELTPCEKILEPDFEAWRES